MWQLYRIYYFKKYNYKLNCNKKNIKTYVVKIFVAFYQYVYTKQNDYDYITMSPLPLDNVNA